MRCLGLYGNKFWYNNIAVVKLQLINSSNRILFPINYQMGIYRLTCPCLCSYNIYTYSGWVRFFSLLGNFSGSMRTARTGAVCIHFVATKTYSRTQQKSSCVTFIIHFVKIMTLTSQRWSISLLHSFPSFNRWSHIS